MPITLDMLEISSSVTTNQSLENQEGYNAWHNPPVK
jgi:hypothetical protein